MRLSGDLTSVDLVPTRSWANRKVGSARGPSCRYGIRDLSCPPHLSQRRSISVRRRWFGRRKPLRHAGGLILGLLSRFGTQELLDLLARGAWDDDGVRDDLCEYVVEEFGDDHAILVLDETGDLKRGAQCLVTNSEARRWRDAGLNSSQLRSSLPPSSSASCPWRSRRTNGSAKRSEPSPCRIQRQSCISWCPVLSPGISDASLASFRILV